MAECGSGRELNHQAPKTGSLQQLSYLPLRAEPVHFVLEKAELATGEATTHPFEGSECPPREAEHRWPEKDYRPVGTEDPLKLDEELETVRGLEVLHDSEIPDPVDGILSKGKMANVGADQVIKGSLPTRETERFEGNIHAHETPILTASRGRGLRRAAPGFDEYTLWREEALGVVTNGRHQEDLTKS